ncbi:MAG: 30S ribosomal protein S9 [Flavobacteriales bacterium]|nr:30S ribosomal protein S9 [Flavobacteriales bacterium]
MATIQTIGRRKTSIARVTMTEGSGEVIINGVEGKEYFPILTQQAKLNRPFQLTETEGKFDVVALVDGGGITGQVEALRLGIARALVEADPEHKPKLKAENLMTRDPRAVERKKFGRKKARKRYQFSKR